MFMSWNQASPSWFLFFWVKVGLSSTPASPAPACPCGPSPSGASQEDPPLNSHPRDTTRQIVLKHHCRFVCTTNLIWGTSQLIRFNTKYKKELVQKKEEWRNNEHSRVNKTPSNEHTAHCCWRWFLFFLHLHLLWCQEWNCHLGGVSAFCSFKRRIFLIASLCRARGWRSRGRSTLSFTRSNKLHQSGIWKADENPHH